MKKKIALVAVCSVFLLLAAVAAGLNAVFSVTSVKLDYSVFSQASRAEAHLLQEDLNKYVGKSTVFLSLEEVEKTVEKYPYFKLVAIEKSYPQTVTVEVTEREEAFSLVQGDAYLACDREGNALGERSENKNRADGAANILLDGMEYGDKYFNLAVFLCDQMEERLNSLRMNVAQISLKTPSSNQEDDYFRIAMREGVCVTISNPSNKTEEKVSAVLDKYSLLFDEDKMFGDIRVFEDVQTGNINVLYTPRTVS